MNLDSLKNFDINSLKNISIEDVRNFINEHQVLALNVAIGAGALIICFFLGNMRLEQYGQLKTRMDDLLVKEDPVRKYEKTLKKTNEMLNAIPSGLTEDDMISYLTEVASRHQAVINEFKPPYGIVESFYSESKISFTCFVPDFYEALAFINDLENSPHLIKVNVWSMTPQVKQDKGQNKVGIRSASGFLMNIDVSSIELIRNDTTKQKKE